MTKRRKVFLYALGGIALASLALACYWSLKPKFGFIGFRTPVMSRSMELSQGDMLFLGSSNRTLPGEAKVTVYSFPADLEDTIAQAKEELWKPGPERWAKFPNEPITFISGNRTVILTIAKGKFVNDPRFYSLRHQEGYITVSIVEYGNRSWLDAWRERLFPKK